MQHSRRRPTPTKTVFNIFPGHLRDAQRIGRFSKPWIGNDDHCTYLENDEAKPWSPALGGLYCTSSQSSCRSVQVSTTRYRSCEGLCMTSITIGWSGRCFELVTQRLG